MREAKNFLVVEDNQADFLLIQRRLKEHGMTARYHRVDRLEDLKAAINAGGWDAVLCDYSVPQLDFLDCYNLIQTELPDVPVILVSGALGEEKAVEMVELGLWGFVLKGNLARLPFVIERGLQAAVDRRAKRAAEAALRASEERARAITESAQDAILTMDTQGRVSFWNPAAERIFGYTRAEAVGQKLHELIAPARHHDAFHAAFPAFQQTGQGTVVGRTVDLEACRKDGHDILVQLSLSTIHKEDGWHAVGILRDVTESKRAETALRQAGAYNRSLIEASLDPLVTIGPDGRITDVNGATEAATGRTRQELIGTDFSNYFTDPGQARSGYQQVFRDQSVRDYPLELRHRDGRVIPVLYNASVYRDEAGQVIGVFAAARDISGLKQAEERLRLQGAALSAAANEVVITDRSGTIQWVNPAFTRVTGYTLEEAVGQNPRILKSGRQNQAFYKHLWDTILRGEVWHGEITNHKKDLSQFTEEAIIAPVKNERGEITHFIAIKQDITEKKLLEAKFLRAQRLEGLGALAGGVAHDLNNVLAPILMCAEMLRARSSDEGAARMLEMIETGAKRGAGMIRQILSFARGTSGERIVMQVGHLLTELRKMMEETFPSGIQCVIRPEKNLQPVCAEPTEIYQILLNLCINARDAMPDGGTLTLGAGNVRLDEACASLGKEAHPGQFVLITVADTGCGISPENQARIFEPFFTTKAPGKGTGLGLATVKDVVSAHGGFIQFHSEVGVGTQFKIYLPAVEAGEPSANTPLIKLPTGHGELVLVVDDEGAVREIVKATLEGYGYRVLTAGDGTEAVARFVEHMNEVKLLFTDIQMPHMDGMATIRALRNIRPDLRVIGTSGLSSHEDALKATGIVVQGFVVKPFTAASLLQALDAALHPK